MTQNRLLDIAIREFGAKGLEGASTRGIAAAAGTAMSAITYHYGGKEGLYLAAADHIATMMAERMGDRLPPTEIDDPEAAREAAVTLLLGMVDTMASPDSEAWAMFIVREQMNPTPAFDRIYAGAMGTMFASLAELIVAATSSERRAACIAAMTLVGQTVSLRSSRAMFLRALGSDGFTADELAEIKARIAANIHAILDRLRAEAQDQR